MDTNDRLRLYARLMWFYGLSYAEVQGMDDQTLLAFEQQRLIIQGEERNTPGKAFEG